MSQFIRKAQPDCMRYFLETLHEGAGTGNTTATIEQLVRQLTEDANYAKPMATETLLNAVHDGLLIPVAAGGSVSSPRGRIHEQKLVRLPSEEEIMHSSHDCYCFECHLPGMLEQCRQCPRAFHRLCYRKDAERPNYTVPSAKLQKNRLPVFSSDTDDDEDDDVSNDEAGRRGIEYESDAAAMRASSSLLPLDQNSTASWTPQRFAAADEEATVDSTSSLLPPPPLLLATSADADAVSTRPPPSIPTKTCPEDTSESDSKIDAKVDIVCLGEVRPPTRKRPATTASSISYKSEISPADEDESAVELCTCCRLLKSAVLRNPPNLQPDELCHLIGYTFERNRTWVTTDVSAYLKALCLNVKQTVLVNRLLFIVQDHSLDAITLKLQRQQYTYLMEFLVDILDLQHNMGVFFGPYSTEMESTKWLVRDIAHDLSEIRRCPDCFRYSHEQRCSIWFAKPCVQRHELVFAKHSGFPYWPAKVIRVLPNSKYDVRFFGGDHSRALIEVRYIRPIDADVKSLKLGNSLAIKKAMEELRYHQVLSTHPPSKFSFHADRHETEQIIRNALAGGLPAGGGCSGDGSLVRRRRGRKSKSERAAAAAAAEAAAGFGNDISAVAHMETIGAQDVSTTIECGGYGSNDMGVEVPSKRYRSKKTSLEKEQAKRITRSTNHSLTPTDLKQIQEDLDDALRLADSSKKKNEKLQAQVQKLKDTIKKHEYEKKILKRKQWCYWCLNEAKYLCCFRAAYCSEVCQSRHWKDGHSKVCKNQDDRRQATSTT